MKSLANFSIDSYKSRGFREIREDVPKIRHKNLTSIFDVSFFLNDYIEAGIKVANSKYHNYYANSLTKKQFDEDPKQAGVLSGGNTSYNYQIMKDNSIDYFLTYWISENLKAKFSYIKSDKTSNYVIPYPYISKYDYDQYDFNLNYEKNSFNAIFGISNFDGKRKNFSNITSKENLGYFISLSNDFNKHKFTVGYRYEQAKYKYNPNSGKKLNDKDNEYAFNAGYNYKLKNNGSIYFNFTRAFQFPDIDRFFTYDFNLRSFQFNKFIKTMLTKTYTIGYNDITDNQKFKISAFCIKAENEIYYNPLTFKNTNLDKTKKKGFDVEYRRKITDFLAGAVNYSYIIPKTKKDDNKKYEGKILPGVSKHNLTLSLNFEYNRFYTNISHIYRSSSYALNDFENGFSQKQKPYNSTDLNFGYKIKRDLEIFARTTNLFGYKNGLWIKDDVIYPDNALRSYYMGIRGSF